MQANQNGDQHRHKSAAFSCQPNQKSAWLSLGDAPATQHEGQAICSTCYLLMHQPCHSNNVAASTPGSQAAKYTDGSLTDGSLTDGSLTDGSLLGRNPYQPKKGWQAKAGCGDLSANQSLRVQSCNCNVFRE
jgi:hypothetical protein